MDKPDDPNIIDIEPASTRNSVIGKNPKTHQKSDTIKSDYGGVKRWEAPQFKSKKLRKMYETEEGTHKYPPGVVNNFFEKMQLLDIADSEQDLYSWQSLGFHPLKKGKRKGQYAVWLTGNWRLIMTIEEDADSKYLLIQEIVDYHP